MASKNKKVKAAQKVEVETTLTCKSVQRIAFNLEEVVLENRSLKITLQIKDPALHGNFAKDEQYDDVFFGGEAV
jgi:hypothetical protein